MTDIEIQNEINKIRIEQLQLINDMRRNQFADATCEPVECVSEELSMKGAAWAMAACVVIFALCVGVL